MPKQLNLDSLRDEQAYVKLQLEAELPRSLRRMWEERLKEIEGGLEETETSITSAASAALIFEGGPVRGQHAIEVDFASNALDSFQDLVANVYAERVVALDVAQRGPVRGKRRSKLFLQDIVHGSMGFILSEEPDPQADAFPSALSEALEEALDLIDQAAAEDEEAFEKMIDKTSPRTILALKRVTDVVHDAGATAKISTNISNRYLPAYLLNRMYLRLHETVKDSEVVYLEGTLNGVFTDDKGYEFFDAERQIIIHGRIDESLLNRYVGDGEFRRLYVTTPITGQFRKTIIRRPGHDDKETYFLERVALRGSPVSLGSD